MEIEGESQPGRETTRGRNKRQNGGVEMESEDRVNYPENGGSRHCGEEGC